MRGHSCNEENSGEPWRHYRRSEEGSGTIAIVGILAILVIIGGVVAAAGIAHASAVRAQAVADLAALAGAECRQSGLVFAGASGDGCDCARQVAQANEVILGACSQDGFDVRVTIDAPWRWGGWEFTVSGRARAGPA